MHTDAIPTDALLIDGPEVARRLGIGLSHLHAMKRAAKFPLTPIRLGRAVRYRADELAAWTAAGCPANCRWAAMKSSGQSVCKM